MKKIFLALFLLSFAATFSAEASDYTKWGSLNNGGIKSTVDYPKGYSAISESIKINPNSYGKQLNFSVYVQSINVTNYAELWFRFDNNNVRYGDKIIGTSNRKVYTLTTPPVPRGIKYMHFGVILEGVGRINTSSYQLR